MKNMSKSYKKNVVCIASKSVDTMIELLENTIELLEISNELLVKNEDIIKNHRLRAEAEEKINVYIRVKEIMKDRNEQTLCLVSSDIPMHGKKHREIITFEEQLE